jgi:hypothetical protein
MSISVNIEKRIGIGREDCRQLFRSIRPGRSDAAAGENDSKKTLPEHLTLKMLTGIDNMLIHVVNILFHVSRLKKEEIASLDTNAWAVSSVGRAPDF